jgi:glyoxylase-like metal-dependent hydrolase (beta-lactamase superfamily II)
MSPLPSSIQVIERGWLSSNNVLIQCEDQITLVDSGYHSHSAQTLQLVNAALAGRKLDLLVNTHLHSDHCGGNAALQAAYPGLPTLIPPGLAPHVRHWDPVALSYGPTGQQCGRFEITGVLQPGGAVSMGGKPWQVHAAPGHDPHSVILFEPQDRVLISADALWEAGFGVIFPELTGDAGFADVGLTLDLIESLNPATVIPGHGKVFTDVAAALAAARKRLNGFVADPRKHAVHAAKVLLKFKLLELQRVHLPEFVQWAQAADLIMNVHHRHFSQQAMGDWVQELSLDLVRSGAAAVEGDWLVNA